MERALDLFAAAAWEVQSSSLADSVASIHFLSQAGESRASLASEVRSRERMQGRSHRVTWIVSPGISRLREAA